MTPKRSSFPALLLLAAAVALTGSVGCTEKNMGGGDGEGGWTKVETGARSSAPAAPLPHADAVNVTYFYLPG